MKRQKRLRSALALILLLALACQAGCGGKEEAAAPQGGGAEHPGGKAYLPASYADAGIFAPGYQRAYLLLETMTVEEKAGQVLLARCPEFDGAEAAAEYHLGGFVLFRRDFTGRNREQVAAASEHYRAAGRIPLVLAVDEEGGTVVRISSNRGLTAAEFPSPGQLYRRGGMEAVERDSLEKAALLKELNIDVLLAPVADISTSEADYMYPRALGEGAEETSRFVAQVVRSSQSQGVSCTLKHFPGYGGNLDTHGQVAVDQRPWEAFESEDLKPFHTGIREGVHCVLVSHNVIETLEPGVPASLSRKITEVLRKDLDFTGIILTDDLVMEGASSLRDGNEPVVEALLSGKDMLIVSDYQKAHRDILAAVETGALDEKLLDEAVFRILSWKYVKGLM